MGSESIPPIKIRCSAFFSGCMAAENTPEAELGWPSARRSCSGTVAGSGSNPNSGAVHDLCLRYRRRRMKRDSLEQFSLLVVEDSPADVFLVREALKEEGLSCSLKIADDGEKAIHIL